ncbi:A/G-specific adenine glycosylase [Anaerovorax odorimutans]|uniref:Adenine DNA glycosylase n=2 Tax=Anaerovorax odorimutans TaxID=109327 RepID=A0ABT1RQ61_9FIRM|nr:A/G-specific adenine glycosylase [Anaerovorax odorimutans]
MTEKNRAELYKKLPGALIPWYRENARDLPWRKDREPYHIWLSEIMLQQTRVEAVKEYYRRFLDKLPTIESLAQSDEDQLMKLWEGLGYYNRARNLQKAARIITFENNGVFPSEYSEIIRLPGIGEYTAGAIASNCFGEPVAAVDGNVLRVISRITEMYDDILKPATKRYVKTELEKVYPKEDCGDFTQSLMELGATVCVPAGSPKCQLCPAEKFCLAHRSGTEGQLPVKEKKKPRRIEERTVFVLCCEGKIAIRQRKHAGLLAGMWEFPNIAGKLTAPEAAAVAGDWGCRLAELEKETFRKHIFSHVEWHMSCFYFRCEETPADFYWAEKEALNGRIALPTAFRQFLPEKV